MAGSRESRLLATATTSTSMSVLSHDQSLRAPWNLSTNVESKSNLSVKEQQSRASWMMSTWSHAPSCSLSTSSPRVSTSSNNHDAAVGEVETPVKISTPRKLEHRPRTSFPTSLSEPNSTVTGSEGMQCPRYPRQGARTPSSVGCETSKQTTTSEAAAVLQVPVKLGLPAEIGRSSSESSTFTPAAACIDPSTNPPSRFAGAGAQQWAGTLPEDWLARLEQLICSPPSIDLVPLRRKHARQHSLDSSLQLPQLG